VRRPALLWRIVGDEGYITLCDYDLSVHIRPKAKSSVGGYDPCEIWATVHGDKTRDEAFAAGENIILRVVRRELKRLQALETELQAAINKAKEAAN
jgi:hypothetical protein